MLHLEWSGYRYLWLADAYLMFTVAVVNEIGCTDTIVAPLEVLRINAAFDSLDLFCNTQLTHSFTNTSIDTSVSFLWDFGGLAFSSDIQPSFTFPDTGIYKIRLTAGVGTSCVDSFEIQVPIYIGGEYNRTDSQYVCR